MANSKVIMVAVFLIAILAVSKDIVTVSGNGCYDDCFNTCTNGNSNSQVAPTCRIMCAETCTKKGADD